MPSSVLPIPVVPVALVPIGSDHAAALAVEIAKHCGVSPASVHQVIASYKTDGNDLSVRDLWQLPDRKSLGLGAWESGTVFHSIEARMVNGDPVPGAAAGANAPKTAATPARSSMRWSTPSTARSAR